MLRSTHDNWEKLVAAVLKRELYLRLCHQDSIASSLSDSSFNSSFRSSFSFHDSNFDHVRPENRLFKFSRPLPFEVLYAFKDDQEHGKLILSDDSPFTFGLRELLSAPSTVLGDEINTYDTTYLVSLRHDLWLVVKRFELGSVTLGKVEKHLKLFADIEHENVIKLRAYYMSKSEAFGIFDYLPQESVHAMLHGNSGVHQIYLNWDARTKVAIGAAKGLADIHSRELYHGNVKASSIFPDKKNYGCLGDPSISNGQSSQASDVYSFGVLLIELISGKSPVLFRGQYRTYTDWALHNGRDELGSLVFDKRLLKDPLVRQEITEMYQVAMKCLNEEPGSRPKMNDVVTMLR